MRDKVLRKHVEDELEWTPQVTATNIGVICDGGVVRLVGHVPSYAQKCAAGRAVQALHGVRALVNDLEVKPPVLADMSDASIAARAADLIDWDVRIPRHVIGVSVENGAVTLSGEVERREISAIAERCVRNLPGLKDVHNEITVKQSVLAADVKDRIRAALERQADLDAAAVEVAVDGDTVRLTGAVKASFERGIVERAAWAAPGVRHVHDLITVARQS